MDGEFIFGIYCPLAVPSLFSDFSHINICAVDGGGRSVFTATIAAVVAICCIVTGAYVQH